MPDMYLLWNCSEKCQEAVWRTLDINDVEEAYDLHRCHSFTNIICLQMLKLLSAIMNRNSKNYELWFFLPVSFIKTLSRLFCFCSFHTNRSFENATLFFCIFAVIWLVIVCLFAVLCSSWTLRLLWKVTSLTVFTVRTLVKIESAFSTCLCMCFWEWIP